MTFAIDVTTSFSFTQLIDMLSAPNAITTPSLGKLTIPNAETTLPEAPAPENKKPLPEFN